MSDIAYDTLLKRAREIAEEVLAPNAERNDQAGGPPRENIACLAKAGLLGLSTPRKYGGFGAPPSVSRQYTEILAGACGLTNFVQGQHQSAAMLIAGGTNDDLKAMLLPKLA